MRFALYDGFEPTGYYEGSVSLREENFVHSVEYLTFSYLCGWY